MPRRQQGTGWRWSETTSGSKGRIGGEVTASTGPDTPVPSDSKPPDSTWTPRASAQLVVSGLFAAQLAGIFTTSIPRHGLDLALTLISAGLLFGLQLCIAQRGATRWSQRRRAEALLAMGVLTYLPLAALGLEWPGMAGFFAGSILILRPTSTSWIPFALVTVSMLAAPLGLGQDARDATYLMLASLSSGLTVFAVYQLRLASKRAHGASAQLAQLTSVRERERFSRDLHDILGYSLSAITLKAELTRKLVGSEPDGAQDELEEVIELARQAANDVRLIAGGYRSVSLAQEAASVASLLSAACITLRVEIDCGALDEKVDAVLATVLREAATNVLRHSMARNCSIEANHEDKMITLSVINDGVRRPARSGPGGHGLTNLAWRLEALGGELTTGVSHDDQFSLLAKVPTQEVPGPPRPEEPDRGGPRRHELGGTHSLRGSKFGLSWRNIGRRGLEIGQGEEDRQVGRPPGAQLDPGGDNHGVGGDRHRAGLADQ
jgi:two-component system, NarL family, sensor histidine kinase DesK